MNDGVTITIIITTITIVVALSTTPSITRRACVIDQSHGSSISWSLADSCGIMSYLRVHEASSRQTLNVESYIRKIIQYHGLVHKLMKIRKRKKNWCLLRDMNCNYNNRYNSCSIKRSNNFSVIRTFCCSSILSFGQYSHHPSDLLLFADPSLAPSIALSIVRWSTARSIHRSSFCSLIHRLHHPMLFL